MESLGNIENRDIALQCIVYNEGNTPTMEVWGNAAGQTDNWKFLGKKADKGSNPGPILTEIGMKGDKNQEIQIRTDNAPEAKLISATAYELTAPVVKSSRQ